MPTIDAVVTDDACRYYAMFFGGILATPGTPTNVLTPVWDPRWRCVRWGEGGWVDPGSGRVPRSPSPSLRRLANPQIQDLDAAVDVTRGGSARYAADERAVFQKNINWSTDVDYVEPGVAKIRCILGTGEFNDDGFGNPPEIWEIGVFSDHPLISGQLLMVAYGTMARVTKIPSEEVERIIRIRFR